MTKPKARKVKAWVVCSDGKPLWMYYPFYPQCRQLQVYKTRREARRTAEEVRRVLITLAE